MAHKKAGGSTRNGRDSNPKYLGVKKFGGESVIAGNIIIRQRGTNCHAGKGVGLDNTGRLLVAMSDPLEIRAVAAGDIQHLRQ